jgi:hypothetical protein
LCPAIATEGCRREECALKYIKLEEMSLARSLDIPLSPRTKEIATVDLDLSPQVVDDLLVFLGGLIVNLRGLVERGLEILDLLSELLQQVVTLGWIGRP